MEELRGILKIVSVIAVAIVIVCGGWIALEYRAQNIRKANYEACLENLVVVTKTMQDNQQGIYTMPSCSQTY